MSRRVHPLSFYHIVGNYTTTFHDIHKKPRGGRDFSQTMENSAAYIAEWLGALDRDKSLLVNAAASAQKAADYILGRTQEE